MKTDLIDKIYEATFVSELWPELLTELGALSESAGASLFVLENEQSRRITGWRASPATEEGTARMVKEGWFWRGRIADRLFAARHAGFLTDLDLLSPDEIAREPIYKGIFNQYGVGWSVGTVIPLPTSETVSIILTRAADRGPVEAPIVQKLDELRPHLARSGFITARLQLERAKTVSDALALIGFAAFVLGDNGKVLASNNQVDKLTDFLSWRANDHVSFSDRTADKFYREAIAASLVGGVITPRSFPVRHAESGETIIAHVIPIRRTARDIFTRCAALLVLSPVSTPKAPSAELIQSLFDLTPAEARVARNLVLGKTVEEIAAVGGVTRNTVRVQLRGVMEKTGCSRQAEVVALLGRMSLPGACDGAENPAHTLN